MGRAKTMEESPPSPTSLIVNSPRRTVSLLRGRRQKHRVSDLDEKAAGAASSFATGFAEVHGPKPSEVYGFVGSITTVIASVIFIVWAYTPEPWLHYLGITYYPSKYWAIAIPSFLMVTVVLAMVFYMGLNFMVTPPPTSFNVMFDDYTRERSLTTSSVGEEQPIEPISDIGVNQINKLMFG
ncbi:phosphatidylinositol N-acetylglucosaminyltransferase subunit P [Canna indica]|uniref:Phosphatidylinositol N-acetylglucosaminyltransferase subunit P n=1 Tax=Canna indica TaxID=4628 RepID=A0AAQ3KE60_9LILI|nr:phosphatidylinositol N-acetylglucosaminyltransferase subunit P [Canna indica]